MEFAENPTDCDLIYEKEHTSHSQSFESHLHFFSPFCPENWRMLYFGSYNQLAFQRFHLKSLLFTLSDSSKKWASTVALGKYKSKSSNKSVTNWQSYLWIRIKVEDSFCHSFRREKHIEKKHLIPINMNYLDPFTKYNGGKERCLFQLSLVLGHLPAPAPFMRNINVRHIFRTKRIFH